MKGKKIEGKIFVALERLCEALRVALWKDNKKYSLSPVQLRILSFLYSHTDNMRTLTNIAKDFTTTKASISDSIRSLEEKKLIVKEKNINDFRVSTINLTEEGKNIAEEISFFASKIEKSIATLEEGKKELLLESLLAIIHKLFLDEVITIHRMCINCEYFIKGTQKQDNYCSLLNKTLKEQELRLDYNEIAV